MKRLLNPKLNKAEVTMIDTSSSDEKIEASKGDFKRKKALKSIEQSSLTQTKLSAVFLELRDEMLKEQQKEEMEASYSENKLLMDETAPDVIADFTTLGESHIVWPSPIPLQTLQTPWTIFCPLMFP